MDPFFFGIKKKTTKGKKRFQLTEHRVGNKCKEKELERSSQTQK